ncbi:hypothetical protein [Gracilibacillus phocaeensis]|uniref:hypothetical protein n=1 Tax=Gracilibacillus phocaeensis TaxID=2042304 RepID=UPI0010307C7B|nr:hypothetical protein [Gracilibacillus phocaeensis]
MIGIFLLSWLLLSLSGYLLWQKHMQDHFFLIVQAVLWLGISAFMISYLISPAVITAVPAIIYWFLIFISMLLAGISFPKKHIPGELMAISLFLFTGFITIFSIGIFLLALAAIGIVMLLFHFKQSVTVAY